MRCLLLSMIQGGFLISPSDKRIVFALCIALGIFFNCSAFHTLSSVTGCRPQAFISIQSSLLGRNDHVQDRLHVIDSTVQALSNVGTKIMFIQTQQFQACCFHKGFYFRNKGSIEFRKQGIKISLIFMVF